MQSLSQSGPQLVVEKCAVYLSQFALSVDSVDHATYQNVQKLLESYFLGTLGSSFFAICIDGVRVQTPGGYQPGLQTVWSSREVADTDAIFADDGSYTGLRTFVYDKNISLWVVEEQQQLLADPEVKLNDQWSGAKDLPPYILGGESAARTAVLLPLSYGGRVFGVFLLEFAESHDCTLTAKESLKVISEALARIIWLHETTRTQLNDTNRAFQALEEMFNASKRGIIVKPRLFMASALHADEQIVGAIRSVLQDFNDEFEVIFWKSITQQGNINNQMLEAISTSQYGICYMSERNTDGATPEYIDNANVLFEAGMLHALTNDVEAAPEAWIPIREDEARTTRAPFDFATERMIIAPRDENGGLIEEAFKNTLRTSLKTMTAGRQ